MNIFGLTQMGPRVVMKVGTMTLDLLPPPPPPQVESVETATRRKRNLHLHDPTEPFEIMTIVEACKVTDASVQGVLNTAFDYGWPTLIHNGQGKFKVLNVYIEWLKKNPVLGKRSLRRKDQASA